MRDFIILSISALSVAFFGGCSSSNPVAPSQNRALNSISNSNGIAKKESYMQKSMDKWLKEKWTPTVSKDKEIQKKYMKKVEISDKKVKYKEDKNKSFTIQEYVDKSAAYMKARPNDYNNSNVKKMESLPVIGR